MRRVTIEQPSARACAIAPAINHHARGRESTEAVSSTEVGWYPSCGSPVPANRRAGVREGEAAMSSARHARAETINDTGNYRRHLGNGGNMFTTATSLLPPQHLASLTTG